MTGSRENINPGSVKDLSFLPPPIAIRGRLRRFVLLGPLRLLLWRLLTPVLLSRRSRLPQGPLLLALRSLLLPLRPLLPLPIRTLLTLLLIPMRLIQI